MPKTLWLETQALLVKAKDEMLARALETLDAEIKAGRAAINGRLVTAVEQNDSETKMFVLENIIDNADNIISTHYNSISAIEAEGGADSKTVQRIEELKKFLLAIGKMRILYDYSTELGAWASEIGADTSGNSEAEMLAAGLNDYRAEIFNFILKNPGEAFNDIELQTMSSSLRIYKPNK
ncbi:MAG: hypothetical protein QXN59_01655 [Candidatus Micrarchaeaceae archaeon]